MSCEGECGEKYNVLYANSAIKELKKTSINIICGELRRAAKSGLDCGCIMKHTEQFIVFMSIF